MAEEYFSEESKKRKEKEELLNKKEKVDEAFQQAQDDLEKDPDFKPDDDADLDEGELARKEGHP